MTNYQSHSLESLDLSWPHSVNYHVDIARSALSNPITELESESADTGNQKAGSKYNGIPPEVLGHAQTLIENEIRVLDLKGGTREMPLEGSLRKVRLSDHHVYEPLSYTWEDYDTVRPSDHSFEDDVLAALFLSDTPHYLNLTSNCAKALYSVRKPTTDRTIWVDSICVNQDDPGERSHQVDLMKEIYARAFTVLVYLGRASTDDDSASDIAMSLLGQPDRLQEFHRLNQLQKTSLRRLFERPYFRRMWIVQEVALAQTMEFHCGSATTYVSKFAGKSLEAILSFQVTPPWLMHSKQAASNTLNKCEPPQADSILTLIFDTALCDCKDDRDRIFALLGLLNPSDEERLKADYGLPTVHVYTGITAYLAKNGFLWGMLMLAPRLALNSCPSLPSWVPQWNNLSRAGLENLQILMRHTFRLDIAHGVASSGVITIQGMFLGPVTFSGYSSNFKPGLYEMTKIQGLARRLSIRKEDFDDSTWRRPKAFLWKLAKSPKAESPDSWGCYFHFFTPCKDATSVEYRAFMLPDYSTVLILRPHDRILDQYTLVEGGMPLVRAILPNDSQVDRHAHRKISLDSIMTTSMWTETFWDPFLSSKDKLSRLSGFPELWRHNPMTSSMTLTHKAIRRIQRTAMAELDLLEGWQNHARTCIQVLKDKTQLRHLIDEVTIYQDEDYTQVENAAGLDCGWSLDHFLGLFIRNPFDKGLMVWPDVPIHGDQPLEEMAVVPRLMQWAHLTDRFLLLLSNENPDTFRWPKLPMNQKLCHEAMAVARFQTSIASANATIDTSRGIDRTSVLLEKIMNQLSEETEQVEGPCFMNECYWDWGIFMSVMEQRLSILSHIRPDVEKIQSAEYPHDFKLVSRSVTTHEVFAAHGIDLRKNSFTQVQIR